MTARIQFINRVHGAFRRTVKINVRDLRRFAGEVGLPQDDKELWELAELAWVMWYRAISRIDDPRKAFEGIVDFYQNIQPTFTARDSTRQIFQQYSTSAPIAWLAGWFTDGGQDEDETEVLEPSAGNGLLTIYYPPGDVTVNEIDPVRLANLKMQGFGNVFNQDASQPFPSLLHRQFEAVLTNPPFGSLGEVNRDYGWAFRKLDHVMVAHALDCMADDGRASIIIGGHTEFEEKTGVVKSGRSFFDWLFRHYRVVDMLNIDSPKLYAKQGTTFPLRLILVAGRKAQPFGFAPNRREFPHYAHVVSSFHTLYDRVGQARERASLPEQTLDDLMRVEVGKIEIETT